MDFKIVCCHSQVIQRGSITSLDTSSLISCSSAKKSSLLWLPKIFFWLQHPSVRSSAYSFAVLCSPLWLMCLSINPSITLNLKYFEKESVTQTLCRVYSRNWPVRVKWDPFCNFRGPFFEKGGPWVGLAERFAATLEHSGQLKKPWLKLMQNPGYLSGEIMTQTKKRKAIETVRGF